MLVDIQESLEVLSVVVYRQAKVLYTFNSRLLHHLGHHHISPTGLLHELPPHSSPSNIAGTSCVSPNLDNVSWKASVLWSNLMGQTFPISSITRWCRNEWMYEDVSVTLHMSCPYSCSSLNYALCRTGVEEGGNLKLWCVVQHEEHITTYLGYGYVLCHTPALAYRHITGQFRYMYIAGPNTAQTSIYCYTIITPVVVTLYYWWHLSQHKLWSKCIWAPDFINPIHQLRFVMSDCWTSMNNYWWETTTPVVPRAIDTCPCSCGRCQLAKWPRYDLIRKQNLVYINPRWW